VLHVFSVLTIKVLDYSSQFNNVFSNQIVGFLTRPTSPNKEDQQKWI